MTNMVILCGHHHRTLHNQSDGKPKYETGAPCSSRRPQWTPGEHHDQAGETTRSTPRIPPGPHPHTTTPGGRTTTPFGVLGRYLRGGCCWRRVGLPLVSIVVAAVAALKRCALPRPPAGFPACRS
ncbi:hypothetical protein ACWDKQ_36415 [Saccharopolyspora sp. NPDC000995]